MAAGKPRIDHEEMRVRVEQAQREVLPAVELEKKEIKMKIRLPVQTVPSIITTTVENGKTEDRKPQDADRIVGITIGLQGVEATVTSADHSVKPQVTQNGEKSETTKLSPTKTLSSPKFGSRLTVEQSHSIIEKTEDLMEFFEGKKKSKHLTKRASSKKPRTPSPSPVRQSMGLDHLDNLVRLMEQLGNLRDENSRLKNRCDYLESTKTLLIAKSNLDVDIDDDEHEHDIETFESNSLPRVKKSKHKSIKSSASDGGGIRIIRPRLPSAEDAKCIELDIGDSCSDPALKRNKSKIMKRSFSTGSLEVPSDITEQSGEDDMAAQRLLTDRYDEKRSSKVSKSPEAKRKSKFSKWAKVKKVLNKQQLSENISSGIKSIKGLGKGAYLRYGSVSGRELTVPHSVAESRSVDSGVGSGVDSEYQDVRKSTSSNEPPSPTRFIERHIDVPTPQVDDIEGIWLGPPEWIEKEREKEKELLKQSAATALSESPKSEPGDIGSPRSVSGYEDDGEKFLQIPIPRRQSSPLLVDSPDEEELNDPDLKRTTSYKDHDVSKEHEESFHKSDKSEKKHRTPWGKMKNIIHTRKDSGKRKSRKSGRESDSFGFEEVSETDMEVYDELKYIHEYLEGPVSRSTPKASPVVFRQKHEHGSPSVSPPGKQKDESQKVPKTATGAVDVSALLGGVSDEFTRKLQEWEELKGKRSAGQTPSKESPEFSESQSASFESAGAVSPEFMKKLEEWEKLKALKSATSSDRKRDSQIELESETSSDETEGGGTPPDRPRQSVNVAEIQLKLSDSFSRKMEEWERQKYRRATTASEPPPKPVSKDRPKSKKTKEEKEKEKLEKLREREIMRVEREEQKLEKEKIRIEKERLRALEREAKIEKMKGRLSQPDMESKFKNPVLSPLSEYKVTTDFARKLHEWEVLKGKDGKDHSTAVYLEAQKRSLQFSLEYRNAHNLLRKSPESVRDTATTDTDDAQVRKTSSDSEDMFVLEESEREEPAQGVKVKREKPPPLTLIPCFDSPEPSPGAQLSDDSSLDGHTTETTESMTASNIASLEKANQKLLLELRHAEFEYNSLQDEVRVLNDRLFNFRNEHVLELDLYKKQLIEGQTPGEITFDTKHMSQTLMHLENKISELKKFGEQLAMSMEGAATVEGEESINDRLVDLLDKMRLLLQQATLAGENTIEEVSKKSSALHNFEKLYSQAMQLQMQMNNLRLSQLERNKEIMNMKRHLLLQEANNLLLQADVTRREAELLYYKEYSQKRQPIKRWNTYSGKEDRPRASLPEAISQKESIFQRVQRLRSARQMLPSTTDSDSDELQKSPPRRESPRIRKRESPKSRKKESPVTRRKESPSMRRKEKESPLLKRKESPKYPSHPYREMLGHERSTDRTEEYVPSDLTNILSWTPQKPVITSSSFSTVTLPTARVVLPKDISPHEMNGVPRKSRSPGIATIYEHKEPDKGKETSKLPPIQTAKGTEPKFPELLIPEWKRQADSKKLTVKLERMPSVERDDVFDSDGEAGTPTRSITEQVVMPVRDKARLFVEKSFDSETSEDTLKYMSPDASPGPRQEPPRFPTEISVIQRNIQEPIETASDPGQSRPNSMIKVSVETHGTPLLLRKPPLGQPMRGRRSQIQIPVIPLKKIKPAQELLEDSQRYRSGQSIYLTRILKRYPMKIECRSRELQQQIESDKENVKAGYVKAIVKQLSREGTPDSKGSPKLGARRVSGDSPKSEFVSHIVQKWPSQSDSVTDKSITPLRDLTNGGQVQKLKQAFNGNGIQERTYSETLVVRTCGSQDIQSLDSSSSASTVAFSPIGTKGGKPVTISSTVTYSSMPLLSLEGEESGRERSATASSGSRGKTYSPLDSPTQRHKIHVAVSMSPGRSRRIIDPSLSPARMRRLIDPASPGRRRRVHEPSPIEIVQEEPMESSVTVAQSQTLPVAIDVKTVPLRSPKSKRKDKSKMGTIEVLCRQSMTFDLGISDISLEGSKELGLGAEGGEGSQTLPIRHSTSSTTSASSQSEVEGATGHSGEQKKSKHKKFMDSAFIQKSKKFFKVSKGNRCPSLECCGSDRGELD